MSKPVVIVGGGLAGLACARVLAERGIEYLILEASDRVGGQLKTDPHQGFLLDRGFQVLFDAYPKTKGLVGELPTKKFANGALVHFGNHLHLIDQGKTLPTLIQTAMGTLFGLGDKIKVVQWTLFCQSKSEVALRALPDQSTEDFLSDYGFSEHFINRFARPFFGGVFLDNSLSVSVRQFAYIWKMLSSGNTVLPEKGIEQIVTQIAEPLAPHRILNFHRAEEIHHHHGKISAVTCESHERFEAAAVVVATPVREAARLSKIEMDVETRSSTVLYFATPVAPTTQKYIVLNGSGKGLVNQIAVLSAIQPGYAPEGLHLVSATILGDRSETEAQLEEIAKHELAGWFPEAGVENWRFMRSYYVENAQLAQRPGFQEKHPMVLANTHGLFLAGEYTSNSSIEGAIESGQKAANQAARYIEQEA